MTIYIYTYYICPFPVNVHHEWNLSRKNKLSNKHLQGAKLAWWFHGLSTIRSRTGGPHSQFQVASTCESTSTHPELSRNFLGSTYPKRKSVLQKHPASKKTIGKNTVLYKPKARWMLQLHSCSSRKKCLIEGNAPGHHHSLQTPMEVWTHLLNLS